MNEAFNLATGTAAQLPTGFMFGNYQQPDAGTGTTVLIYPDGATGGVAVRGGAPATRETDLLNPINMVQVLHAVVLSGGSAFGLDASAGVMRWLSENNIGLRFAGSVIPIVTGACLFDLMLGDANTRPDDKWGYLACQNAASNHAGENQIITGNVGAGTGASVGKMLGADLAMKAGLGAASISLKNLTVTALAAVNAAGNVFSNQRSEMIAGTRNPMQPNQILDPYDALLAQIQASDRYANANLQTDNDQSDAQARTNTTIACVLTNAIVDKAQATRIAGMAHDGYARSIDPVHTSSDGDTVFVMAGNLVEANPDMVGILAARAMEAAIVNAAMDATGAYGLPAWRDLA
jgi:L-aminopeptidase/D-esterase-like protein